MKGPFGWGWCSYIFFSSSWSEVGGEGLWTEEKEILVCVLECCCPWGTERIELGNKRGARLERGTGGGGHISPFLFFPQMTRITPLPRKMKCSCRTPASGLNRHIMHMEPTHPSTPLAPHYTHPRGVEAKTLYLLSSTKLVLIVLLNHFWAVCMSVKWFLHL